MFNKTIMQTNIKLLSTIIAVLLFNITYANTDSLSKAINPLPLPAVTIGSTFAFSSLDEQLASMELAAMQAMPMPPESDPSFVSQFMVTLGQANLSKDVTKAKEICDKAIEAGRYIDKLTGGNLESMPITKKQTIGGKDIYIIFQSARIYPKYTELEVYIRIDFKRKDFNGQDAILYFGAKDIKFSNDKGIISGSVGLLADYAIKLAPNNEKAGLYLKKMEITPGQNGGDPIYNGTFVNFDCDGFKEMGIGGAIFFSREWVIPTDAMGNPRAVNASKDLSSTPRVNCHFQFTMQDWDDWLLEGFTIDHFILNKWRKVSVFVGNANIDFSTVRNSATMPAGFDPTWEGVYIEKIDVTLPEPFKRKCQPYTATAGSPSGGSTCRIKISAEHLMIGNDGVSGDFTVQGQAPIIGGPIMNGQWAWSLDEISLGLQDSDIDHFEFSGALAVPILSKQGPLAYNGSYVSDPSQEKYVFEVTANVQKSFPIWNAAVVNIEQASIIVSVVNGEFRPAVTFDGNLAIGNPADFKQSQTGSPIKMPGISFEQLKLQTITPYISVGGIGITGGEAKVAGFPVTVSNPLLSTSGQNGELLSLAFTIGINLMDQGSGVSASGDLEIVGHLGSDQNGARYWEFDDFNFNGASVELSLPQFYAYGQLCFFNDDPVYGNGFSARVDAKVIGENLKTSDGKFNISMSALFGSNDAYRFWNVDGFVSGSGIHVPLFPPFYLDGFGGGAFHHMKPTGYAENNSTTPPTCNSPADHSGLIYTPERETKLGLKFSTSIGADGGTMEGMLTVIIRFGNNFNLQNIMFWGTADIMLPKEIGEAVQQNIKDIMPDIILDTDALLAKQQADVEADALNKIKAKVGLNLDFENGFIIHGFADVKINIASIITGHGTVDLILPIKPDAQGAKWHFYLGGYYDGSVTTTGFFDENQIVTLAPVSVAIDYGSFQLSANAYFLTGNDIPGPPPPHPDVVAFFGPEGASHNRGKLECGGKSASMGTGIAFGAACFFDFEKVKSGWFKSCVGGYKIDLGGGIGFDLALLKYGPGESCSGGGSVGGINGTRAMGRVFAFVNIQKGNVSCIPLPHLGIGVKLRFDVVKPSYFQGVVKLDFIKELTFQVEWGDECGKVCHEEPIED